MSREAIVDNIKVEVPKITCQHISQLLGMLENDFAKELEKEAWLNSQNPTAVLIKNLHILYDDLTAKYYNQFPEDTAAAFNKFKNKSKKSASQKVLRLVFKWGEQSPQALEYLKKFFGDTLVLILQSQFHQKQSKTAEKFPESLICLDPLLSNASPKFQAFVGKAKHVYMSSDKSQVERLVNAFKKSDFYTDKIFEHPYALYYAMAACYEGKMSPEQYNILSSWLELKKTYGADKVVVQRLLDEYGRFTKEAEEYLLKYYKNTILDGFEDPFITKDNLETLRKNFLKLPESEQIFVTLKSCDEGYRDDLILNWEATSNFGLTGEKDLKNLSFLPLTGYQCFIDTVFPEHPAKLKARLGPIDREDVEATHKVNTCFVSTYFKRPSHLHNPGSNRYFHTVGAKTTTAVGIHDLFHGLMLSSANQKALEALQKIPVIVRDSLKIKWSTGLWTVADAPFIEKEGSESAESTSAFIGMLNTSYPTLFQQASEYLPEIAVVLMDCYYKKSNWESLINHDQFSSELSRRGCVYWRVLKEYAGFFNSSDNHKLTLLKFGLVYKALQSNESEEQIISALLFCDGYFRNNPDKFEKNTTFKMAKRIFRSQENQDKSGEEESEEAPIPETFALLCWNKKEFNSENMYDIFSEINDNQNEASVIDAINMRIKNDSSLLLYIFDEHFKYFITLAENGIVDIRAPYNHKNQTFLHRAMEKNNLEKIEFLTNFNHPYKNIGKKENSLLSSGAIDATLFGQSEQPSFYSTLFDEPVENNDGNPFNL